MKQKTDSIHLGIVITLVTVVILLLTTIGTATFFLGGMSENIVHNTKIIVKQDEKFEKLDENIVDIQLSLVAIELKLGVEGKVAPKTIDRLKERKEKQLMTFYTGD